MFSKIPEGFCVSVCVSLPAVCTQERRQLALQGRLAEEDWSGDDGAGGVCEALLLPLQLQKLCGRRGAGWAHQNTKEQTHLLHVPKQRGIGGNTNNN